MSSPSLYKHPNNPFANKYINEEKKKVVKYTFYLSLVDKIKTNI